MMWGYGEGAWPFVHGFGWLFMLLLTVLIVMGILALFRASSGGGGRAHGGEGGDRALDVLRERYARGELTREQFEQMKRDLA